MIIKFVWLWLVFLTGITGQKRGRRPGGQRPGRGKFGNRNAVGRNRAAKADDGNDFKPGFGVPTTTEEPKKKRQRATFANGVIGAIDQEVPLASLEDLAEQDPIGKAWLQKPDLMQTTADKRYAQIKTLLLAFQGWQSFGKFDYYGCYCFPDGALGRGSGNPVDAIDEACKKWQSCQMCASLDDTLVDAKTEEPVNCDNEIADYKFMASYKKDTTSNQSYGKNKFAKINCEVNLKQKHGTCDRAICECDAQFIETLSKLESEYNIDHHEIWGGFDRNAVCNSKHQKKEKKSETGESDNPSSIAKLKSAFRIGESLSDHSSSISDQMEKHQKEKSSLGIIDSCCVKQYPFFQLYRSLSQKCCSSTNPNEATANIFYPGKETDSRHYECCADGKVHIVEEGGCEGKDNRRHSEF